MYTRDKRRLFTVNEQLKKLNKEREKLRKLFFEDVTDTVNVESALPTKTVSIPYTFWIATGLDVTDYVETRHPGWKVTAREDRELPDEVILVLTKKPEYVPHEFRGKGYKVSRTVTEPTPELDIDSLRAEFPGISKKILKEVVSHELDEEAFQRHIEEHPEFLEQIKRHLKVKPPIAKLDTDEVKENDD